MKKLLLPILLSLVAGTSFGMQPSKLKKSYWPYAAKTAKITAGFGISYLSAIYGAPLLYCMCTSDAETEDSSFHTGLSKKKILPEDLNFKAVDTNLGNCNYYKFALSKKTDSNLDYNEVVAEASVICRKNSDTKSSDCELMRIEIERKGLRSKGYGSFLLQEVLKYMKTQTDASQLGLVAIPMDWPPCTAQKTLNRFYTKNGAANVPGSSQEFVFNLRQDKI